MFQLRLAPKQRQAARCSFTPLYRIQPLIHLIPESLLGITSVDDHGRLISAESTVQQEKRLIHVVYILNHDHGIILTTIALPPGFFGSR